VVFALVFSLLNGSALFTVDASASISYELEISREALRGYMDDIGLFARNMPGVVEVSSQGADRYLYRTEKHVPLAGALRTDFLIEKSADTDSVTMYRSVDDADHNYMACRVVIRPLDTDLTSISIFLRVRLRRENPSEIHWLAPLLGEEFISRQMTDDLVSMLDEFVDRSNSELYSRLKAPPSGTQ
jgi:hypothetical protein